MAIIISVGSGKGGTGKSMVLANLALLLAKRGKGVCLVDLDVGGANAHILYGVLKPEVTLTDFLNRKVKSLQEAAQPLSSFHGVHLIAGTGETLKTANMPFQTKQRLLRSLASLEYDIVLVDVGAGTGFHALDFFMSSHVQVCVTTTDPTAIIDFYRFLKLSAVRKALSAFLSHDAVSKTIASREFKAMEDVLELADSTRPGARQKAESALSEFRPCLVINQVRDGGAMNKLKLRHVARQFLGVDLPELGEVPWDEAVQESVRAYMPICEYAPESPASKALEAIAGNLLKRIEETAGRPGASRLG